jgi:hypothetical protein
MRYLLIIFALITIIFTLNSDAHMGIDLGISIGTGTGSGSSPGGDGDTMLWDTSTGDVMLWDTGGDTMLWDSSASEPEAVGSWDSALAVFDNASGVWVN